LNSPENNNLAAQLTSGDAEAIMRFREAIITGKHWYFALLETVGVWDSAEEIYRGHHYRYLIDGEAFDWQLLAERLCDTVDGLLPENEKNALLLHNQPPLDITKEQFRNYIGNNRYRQYLNFYYGVTVERSLVLAVKDEIRKEQHVAGFVKDRDNTDEAFRRVYGDMESILLEQFRKERHHRRLKSMSLSELKEFTYWLFKYRLKYNDKERVASDTRKALEWLQRHGTPNHMLNGQLPVIIEQPF
jgi:hypothetical protein